MASLLHPDHLGLWRARSASHAEASHPQACTLCGADRSSLSAETLGVLSVVWYGLAGSCWITMQETSSKICWAASFLAAPTSLKPCFFKKDAT